MSASSATGFETDIDDIDSLVTPETSTIVYRIIQEAVNNVLTHAKATNASIAAKATPGRIDIRVRHNGRGMPVAVSTPRKSYGFGLSGIDQRVKMLSGTWTIDSTPFAGTTIHVAIPVRPETI
jgi:signal transduction histidine kinase